MASNQTPRPDLCLETDLTRLVRILLHRLKAHLLENTSISVSVDYDDTVADGLNIVAVSKLPSLVLSGPRLVENRFYSTNTKRTKLVENTDDVLQYGPPLTVDLRFRLTAVSDRTVELLNLMAAVATFLNRHRWIEMNRDPGDLSSGKAQWELDLDDEFRTKLSGEADVRVFTCGLVIRGFDVDEGASLEPGKLVLETELQTEKFNDGEVS